MGHIVGAEIYIFLVPCLHFSPDDFSVSGQLRLGISYKTFFDSCKYTISQIESDTSTDIYRVWTAKIESWECSGSVVECLTRYRRAAFSSLNGVTALCS